MSEPTAAVQELTERIRAFQQSRALLTAIKYDVFGAIGNGAAANEVARRVGADPRATEMLLNALAALGAIEKSKGVFRNMSEASQQLCGEARLALLHTVHLWPRWSMSTDCVRAGKAVQHEEVAVRGEEWTEAFIAAMHRNALERAPVSDRWRWGRGGVRRMLDVGGGSGAYSIAFAAANPELRADILDLTTVAPIAERHIAQAGLSERVKTRAGDLRRDDYGSGYDVVFISAICHMLGPVEVLDMLRKCSCGASARRPCRVFRISFWRRIRRHRSTPRCSR